MATIKQIKAQIENANALGIANLTTKGVEIAENATTYDIMTAIAEISDSGGGGVTYSSIIYNEDDTITLTDKEGVEYTMSCIYEDGKLIGVTYDGKTVKLTYDGDVLVKVGKTAVDLGDAPSSKNVLSEGEKMFFRFGDAGFTMSGEPCDENPFEQAKFYDVTVDGVTYRAGSNGVVICTDARDNVHLAAEYEAEGKTLMYVYAPQGEEDFTGIHTIKISERNTEEIGWRVTINDWGYWYFYSNAFVQGKIDVRVIDEDGTEYWSTENLSFDKIFDTEDSSAFGFEGAAHATDMPDTLEKAVASGKEITFIMKQTIDGVTTTKTYSGTYVAYYENPFSEDVGSFKYEYVLGNDYIPCAEGRSA